jgi:hypothetical protein
MRHCGIQCLPRIFVVLAISLLLASPVNAAVQLSACDFSCLGAFRLPDGYAQLRTFAYGGNAMAFNPLGDPAGTGLHTGSLFITGHDRIAYGAFPNGNMVQPIDIGEPLEVNEFPDDRPAQVIEIGKPLNADDPNTMVLGLPDQAPIEIGRPLDVEDASVNALTESQQTTIEIGEPLDVDLSETQVVGSRSSPIIGPSPNGGVSVIRSGESDQVRP